MFPSYRKLSRKAGLPPGTLIHIGEQKIATPRIRIMDYDDAVLNEHEFDNFVSCVEYIEKTSTTWINIDGLHSMDLIETIGNKFNLHPLVLEDIVHTGQRPKIEEHDDYLFITMRMLMYDQNKKELETEQFSLILGSYYIITFQEREGDVFDTVRERLRKKSGRIRTRGPDYLAYALIDAIVDNYFAVLEGINERIGFIEDELSEDPGPDTLKMIHHMKTQLIFLRKSVWPLRDVISSLEREESSLIKENTTVFFRDVYDHTIQVMDSIDTFRDLVSGMLDFYLSSISNRMNEVMKVLTIIATIFMPMTFIAGIYGMNFRYMPELDFPWGYPIALGIMLAIAIIMLIWFRRNRFL